MMKSALSLFVFSVMAWHQAQGEKMDCVLSLKDADHNVNKRSPDSKIPYMFETSPIFGGRYYFMVSVCSAPTWTRAQEICGYYGGYLAEIKTDQDFNFIWHLHFTHFPGKIEYFWLGGRDISHKNNWVYPRTGERVWWNLVYPFYFRNNRCQAMEMKDGHLRMTAIPCTQCSHSVYFNRFICEIPL